MLPTMKHQQQSLEETAGAATATAAATTNTIMHNHHQPKSSLVINHNNNNNNNGDGGSSSITNTEPVAGCCPSSTSSFGSDETMLLSVSIIDNSGIKKQFYDDDDDDENNSSNCCPTTTYDNNKGMIIAKQQQKQQQKQQKQLPQIKPTTISKQQQQKQDDDIDIDDIDDNDIEKGSCRRLVMNNNNYYETSSSSSPTPPPGPEEFNGDDDGSDDDGPVVVIDESTRSSSSSTRSSTTSTSTSTSTLLPCLLSYTMMADILLILLVIVGAISASLLIIIGNNNSKQDQELFFIQRTNDLVEGIRSSFHDYEVAGQWVQESCRQRTMTRNDFHDLYLNLISTGLEFQVTSFNPNITDGLQRHELEDESRRYYETYYPHIKYEGIVGLEPTIGDDGQSTMSIQPRSEQPYYFPVHLLEPIEGNEAAIDFDLYSSSSRRQTIHRAFETWKPALTPRLHLVQETDPSAFSVILMHPGIPLNNTGKITDRPDSFSSIVIRIPDLLQRAYPYAKTDNEISIYIFDTSNPVKSEQFLGGMTFQQQQQQQQQQQSNEEDGDGDNNMQIISLPEIELDTLRNQQRFAKSASLSREETVSIVEDQTWDIIVIDTAGVYEANSSLIILAGTLLFLLCVAFGCFVHATVKRMTKLQQLKTESERERAKLIVDNAKRAADAERELNQYIAHEVRNPLASAMSACSFVSTAIVDVTTTSSSSSNNNNKTPTEYSIIKEENDDDEVADEGIDNNDEEQKNKESIIKDDLQIIESSLHFINDLLRNMLDMQRARSGLLPIDKKPTHLLNDVLKPVNSMLHQRNANFDVELDCQPPNLVVSADSLRLKQIMLNLARNAAKFVDHGFIRLKALVVNEQVRLCVEDSGPGIPEEKRKNLFVKFQESLDSMTQGTGLGLCLCKNLANSMDGRLFIDEDYDSGIPGCVGTRVVLDLRVAPMKFDEKMLDMYEASIRPTATTGSMGNGDIEEGTDNQECINATNGGVTSSSTEQKEQDELPQEMLVLFVDDDLVLRKLFSRSVRKVAPTWKLKEASNGETALELAKEDDFDLIFMDQYMTSAQKQMLGTEATRALRAQGATSRICGLSANDVGQLFLDAGADDFMFKPFPCEANALKRELIRICAKSVKC